MALQPIGLDATIEHVPDFTGGIDKMNRAVDSFASNSSKQGGMFSGGFGEIVTGALRKVGELGVQALMQAGRAVAGFVKDSIGLAGDFQANMLQFQSVAGRDVDTKGLEKFKDLFLSLGKELPVSTSDVQQAAIEMVKGGIDPATIAAGGLRQNIQFAAAAMNGDLVKAAEISSKILGGWAGVNATAAEKADFLTHSTDLLTKAANASSTDVEGLSRGIFQAQGIARTAGVSFDDLTTTLAELAPRFASSAEAGTSLKNLIARLQPTTDPATMAMTRLGLYTQKTGSAFYDAAGNFVGFEQASALLQNSLKGLTKEQQAAALQTIFGNDAMSAAAALSELGAKGYSNMAAALLNANGVAEAGALKQQGFNTALDNAKGSVEALQITIGSALLPVLTDLMNNTIAPAVNTITSFAEAFMKMVPAIEASDDPLQTFLNALKVAAPQFLDIITNIERFKDSFLSFADSAKPVTDFIGNNLTPILFGIGTAITASVLPAMVLATAAFIEVAVPIVALVAAGALLYKAWTDDWGGIQEKTAAVWAFLEPIFTTAVDWLQVNIPKAITVLSDYWTGTLVPALKVAGQFFEDHIFPVLKDLADVYIAAAIIEVRALAALWTNVLQPALKVVWDFISGSVIPIFKALFEVNWAIATKAVEAMAGLWQKVLQPAFKAVGDYITSTVVPALTSVGSYLSATLGPILTDAKKWLDSVTGGFGGVTGAVKDVVTWLGNLASSISNLKLPDWLTPGSPTPFETALVGIGSALQKSVAPGLATMRQGMRDIGAEITGAFLNTDFVDMLSGLGEDAMAGFGKGLKSGTEGVIRVINSTASTVEGAFNDAFGAHSPATLMIPVGENVTQGLMLGITNLLPGLIGLIDQVGTDMILALTKNKKKMGDEINAMMVDLVAGVKDIASQINDAIADGFGATASIDRQIVSNLDKFKDIPDAYRQYTEGALKEAQQLASEFADPTQGAKFFQMRSKQILEYTKLQKDLADQQQALNAAFATEGDPNATQDQQTAALQAQRAAQAMIATLQQQMILVNAAQRSEIQQFDAQQAGQTTPMQDIAAQIAALFHGDALKDKLPGILENQIIAQLTNLFNQLQSPPGVTRTPYNPNAVSTTNTTTLNMPIYTNNSPSAMQDSMAIAGAALL